MILIQLVVCAAQVNINFLMNYIRIVYFLYFFTCFLSINISMRDCNDTFSLYFQLRTDVILFLVIHGCCGNVFVHIFVS